MERQTKQSTRSVELRVTDREPVPTDGQRRQTIEGIEGDAVGRTRACPVCEFTAGTQSGVYLHLQIDHRKSELARALLDTDE